MFRVQFTAVAFVFPQTLFFYEIHFWNIVYCQIRSLVKATFCSSMTLLQSTKQAPLINRMSLLWKISTALHRAHWPQPHPTLLEWTKKEMGMSLAHLANVSDLTFWWMNKHSHRQASKMHRKYLQKREGCYSCKSGTNSIFPGSQTRAPMPCSKVPPGRLISGRYWFRFIGFGGAVSLWKWNLTKSKSAIHVPLCFEEEGREKK